MQRGKIQVKSLQCKAVAYECFLKTFSRFLRFNFRALYKDIKRFFATSNANIRFVRVVRPEKTTTVSVSSILMVFPWSDPLFLGQELFGEGENKDESSSGIEKWKSCRYESSLWACLQ